MAFNSFYIDLAVTRDLASAPRTAAEKSQTYRADRSGYDLVEEGRDMCIFRILKTTLLLTGMPSSGCSTSP
jgi:hypothetical protein